MRTTRYLAAVSMAIVAQASLRGASDASRWNVSPVPTINATKYLGRWIQAYADLLVMATFELGNVCVQADYALNPNGTVSVHNRAHLYSANGEFKEIYGYATLGQPPNPPSALTVYLQGVPVGAPYTIFALGPETYGPQGLYQWALVSDSLNLSLFVLARNITDYMSTYDAEVQQVLASAGFTNVINKPILTNQTNCTYY